MPKKPEDNRYYNPHNEKHQILKEIVEEFLQRNQTVYEADLAKDIQPMLQDEGISLTVKSTRNILTELRKEMQDEGTLQLKEEEKGGRPKKKYRSQIHES